MQKTSRRARAYAYTAVTTGIVLFFALAEWATERYISGLSRAASSFIEIAIVLVATLAFRPLHQRVEAAIDEAFNRRKREALVALGRFRRELSSFNDLNQLLRRVIEAVDHSLEARACAIYLRRESFRAEASSFDVAAGDLDEHDPLLIRLRSSGAPAHPRLLNSTAHGTHAFPMTVAGDLVGFLLVHAKDDEYDEDEAQMLGGLAQDLAAAAAALDPALRPQKFGPPNNLPANLPALIGRNREIAEIGAAMSQSRLVTLAGTGGVGKTALALHCAQKEIARHEHGVWFIDLAPITGGDLIAATMLLAFGAGSAEPGGEQKKLVEYLKPRDLLLVVDNCEHLAAAVASLFAQISSNCARVKLLATSRELLHVDGEQVYRLGPLRVEAAAELFIQRASAVAPQFDAHAYASAIHSICEHLDGIPLAVELAAARVRALSPDEISTHLNEGFRLLTASGRAASARQQTLAATIEWSYGLLSDEEQSLLLRLSAFRGSFTLAAAAAVCAQGGMCDEFHVLDVLTSLMDKSLLIANIALTTRYRLLETIREFAAQKTLEQSAEAIARGQHAAYFAALAAQAYYEFDTRLPQGWLDRLTPDIDNFRAALEWTLEGPGDRHTGAQMAADCGPIFLRMQLLAEGLRWCEAARQVSDVSHATAGRIEYVASMVHNNLAASADALIDAERAAGYYRLSTDKRGLAQSLSQVAQQYARAKRHDEAQPLLQEAIAAARELADPRLLIVVLRRCAFALRPDDIDGARALFSEAVEVAQGAGEGAELSRIIHWWADREAACGFLERAIELAEEALHCADVDSTMHIESQIAGLHLALGHLERAEPHAREALRMSAQRGHDYILALSIAYCAPYVARDDAEQAAMLFAYAKAKLEELSWQPRPEDDAGFSTIRRAIQNALADRGLDEVIASRAALTGDAAIASLAIGSTGGGHSHGAAFGGGHRVRTLLS